MYIYIYIDTYVYIYIICIIYIYVREYARSTYVYNHSATVHSYISIILYLYISMSLYIHIYLYAIRPLLYRIECPIMAALETLGGFIVAIVVGASVSTRPRRLLLDSPVDSIQRCIAVSNSIMENTHYSYRHYP